jgi:hypothetical protein
MKSPTRLQTFHRIDETNADSPLRIMVNSDRRWGALSLYSLFPILFSIVLGMNRGAVGRLTVRSVNPALLRQP